MLRHFMIQHKQLRHGVLTLIVVLCTLILKGTAAPGGIATKPLPKDPPWPLTCRLESGGTPCGLLY